MYSDDSGYDKIIDLYLNWTVDEDKSEPVIIQPIAYRGTLSGLLARRFANQTSPESELSPLTVPRTLQYFSSIPSLCLTPDNGSAHHQSESVPTFAEFTRGLMTQRSDLVSPLSHVSPLGQLASPHYAAISPSRDTFFQPALRASPETRATTFEHDQQHLPEQVSPRITDVVDSGLVPPPLELARASRDQDDHSSYRTGRERRKHDAADQERLESRSSRNTSDSSFVVYTGVRESLKAMIKAKLAKRKHKKKKDHERKASEKSINSPVSLVTPSSSGRKFSWVSSSRSSLQDGVSNMMRNLSLRRTMTGKSQSTTRSRRRPRQLAVPLTSYQKYGPAVWHNSQRKKRRQARAARGTKSNQVYRPPTMKRHPTMRVTPGRQYRGKTKQPQSEVYLAFQSGREQIINALDDTKHRLISVTNPDQVREARNRSIARVGSDSPVQRTRAPQTKDEERRQRLKDSISFIGPTSPDDVVTAEDLKGSRTSAAFVTLGDLKKTADERRAALKHRITVVGPIDPNTGEALPAETDHKVEYWL